jgi:flagellar FliL protein
MVRPTDDKLNKDLGKKPMEPGMLMLISNTVMLLVILVAFFVMYMLFNSSMDKKLQAIAPDQEQEQIEEDEQETVKKEDGILLELEDTILNLSDSPARKYLKVGVAMEISKTNEEIEAIHAAAHAKPSGGHGHGAAAPVDPNVEIIATIERYKPIIKDAIISVLSSKTSDELLSQTGKEIAKEEIAESVNAIFEGKRNVMRVSFGQFVVQ